METSKGIGDDSALGGLPIVDARTGGQDMRMLRRAVKEGWPITPEIRQLIVNQMALTVGKSEEERNRIAAAKVLIAADGINAKREATDTPQLHLHGQIGITEVIVELPKAEQPKQIILEPHAVLPG